MYLATLKQILVRAVDAFAAKQGVPSRSVLDAIREEMDEVSVEHRKVDPKIDYHNPLCRLGYLYRHVAANATLFERVIKVSKVCRALLKRADGKRLRICSVGGGPGSELLGLAKHLSTTPAWVPARIDFTIMDNIGEWAETWEQLADAVEPALAGALNPAPGIDRAFITMDVADPGSYSCYAYKFSKTDLVVYNYLFSENKTRLVTCKKALTHLVGELPRGAVVVVIDRLEAKTTFRDDVRRLVVTAGLSIEEEGTIDSWLDHDEQVDRDIGDLLVDVLGSPRTKFFTDVNRNPTVFWLVAVKP